MVINEEWRATPGSKDVTKVHLDGVNVEVGAVETETSANCQGKPNIGGPEKTIRKAKK